MMRMTKQSLFTLMLLAAPRVALACPVCFGQSDSPLAKATNMGIFLMLGVVAAVLSGFGAFFIYLSRRARLAHVMESNAVAGVGPVPDPEGTM
jgi:hypothetical protein